MRLKDRKLVLSSQQKKIIKAAMGFRFPKVVEIQFRGQKAGTCRLKFVDNKLWAYAIYIPNDSVLKRLFKVARSHAKALKVNKLGYTIELHPSLSSSAVVKVGWVEAYAVQKQLRPGEIDE